MKREEVLKRRVIKEVVTKKTIDSFLCKNLGALDAKGKRDAVLFSFYQKAMKQTAGCSISGGLKKIADDIFGKKLSRRCKAIANDGLLERVDLSSDFLTISDKFILSEIVSMLNPSITCIYCAVTDEFYFYDRKAVQPYGLHLKKVNEKIKNIFSLAGEKDTVVVKTTTVELYEPRLIELKEALERAKEKAKAEEKAKASA